MRPPTSVAEASRSATPVVAQPQFEPALSVAPFVLVALLAVWVAAAVWSRRTSPGSGSLTVLALGAGWWSAGYALELSSPTLAGTLLFGRLAYLGIVVVPVTWLTFALAYTGRGEWVTRRRLVTLAAPAAAMVGLAWTTPVTGLVWRSYELVSVPRVPMAVLSVEYGPAFWVWTAYAYTLTAAGTLLLVLSVADAQLFRRQTAALLVAVTAPWVGNLLFLTGTSALDLTPVGFAVSAVVLGGGLSRYRLLDVLPVTGGVAREELVENLLEGLVAVDDRGRVVDMNPSAESILDTTLDDAVGAELETVAPAFAALVDEVEVEAEADTEVSKEDVGGVADYVVDDPRRYYEVRTAPLRSGRAAGRLLTLRDVTERRRREQEVAVLNRVLRHDLRNDVAVIENYATLLERDPGNEAYTARIADRATEMRELVETVRQVERHLDADEPLLSTMDIVRVVDERTTALARAHPDATVETELPPQTWVRATELIGSAVDNLVENAVEHNDAETPHVRVSVEQVTVDGDRYVDVTVADNGPPLDDADRAVLVGREPTLEGASGLGLWLVNWIVAESGGEVHHEPNEPRGNVVTLRLRTPEGDRYEGLGGETSGASDEPTVTYRRGGTGNGTGPGNGSPVG